MCFLQEQNNSGLFIPKYDKYVIMTADMCTKPCGGPIISGITK